MTAAGGPLISRGLGAGERLDSVRQSSRVKCQRDQPCSRADGAGRLTHSGVALLVGGTVRVGAPTAFLVRTHDFSCPGVYQPLRTNRPVQVPDPLCSHTHGLRNQEPSQELVTDEFLMLPGQVAVSFMTFSLPKLAFSLCRPGDPETAPGSTKSSPCPNGAGGHPGHCVGGADLLGRPLRPVDLCSRCPHRCPLLQPLTPLTPLCSHGGHPSSDRCQCRVGAPTLTRSSCLQGCLCLICHVAATPTFLKVVVLFPF